LLSLSRAVRVGSRDGPPDRPPVPKPDAAKTEKAEDLVFQNPGQYFLNKFLGKTPKLRVQDSRNG